MRIYFVRHGIAEDLSTSDFARELTNRGRVRLANAAKVIKQLGLRPSVIFTSPRLRSLQTAEIIAAELKIDVTVSEAVNFGFILSDVQSLTRDMTYDDEVMFVGHNPDLSELVNEMTGSDVAMKKGGLARVDVYDREAAQGELVWLIAPKLFDALRQQGAKKLHKDDTASAALPDKPAVTYSPLHALIKRRWSPVSFDPTRPIGKSELFSILEAARWAASSYNSQPWRFIVAPRDNKQEFGKVFSVLKEGNQSWAKHAGVLMIAVSQTHRDTGEPNSHAIHDLGLAIGQMVLQALDYDIYAHQMGGFYPEKARELYRIPANYEPKTAIAFGYRASDLSHLSHAQRERDASGRQRNPLAEMVFNGAWAQRASFLD